MRDEGGGMNKKELKRQQTIHSTHFIPHPFHPPFHLPLFDRDRNCLRAATGLEGYGVSPCFHANRGNGKFEGIAFGR